MDNINDGKFEGTPIGTVKEGLSKLVYLDNSVPGGLSCKIKKIIYFRANKFSFLQIDDDTNRYKNR